MHLIFFLVIVGGLSYFSVIASKKLKWYLISYVIISSVSLFLKSTQYMLTVSYLNNIIDIFFIITVLVIIFKIFNGDYSGTAKYTDYKILYWFFFSFLIIYFFSYMYFGLWQVKTSRAHLFAQLFLFAFAGYENSEVNRKSFLIFLRVLVISTIILYIFRVTGILPILYEGKGYTELRFITNGQTLYLMMFYIYISRAKLFKFKITRFDNILYLISFILIITSTQRMVTFIFVAYLIFDLLTNTKKNIVLLMLIVAFVSVLYIYKPMEILLTFKSDFDPMIYNYEHSNAYGKSHDILASTKYLVNHGQLLFGRLFQSELFYRSSGSFSSGATRGIHNLYITYLVCGGLFLFIPYMILIFNILRKNAKYLVKKYARFQNQLVFLLVLSIFLFSNSSGAAFHNSIVLGYALLISKKENDHNFKYAV